MAFTDDFTGADGQPLSARSGWSLAFGEEAIYVASNALTKGATTDTSTAKVYYRADDGATTQSVIFDQSPYTATNWPSNQPLLRPFVLGSGATNATFSAYFIAFTYVNAATYSVQVQRYDSGNTAVPGGSPTINISGVAGIELRVSVSGGAPTLSIYQNGTQLGSFTDNDTNRKTNGRRGILSRVQNAAGSGPIIDSYRDDGPPNVANAQASLNEGSDTTQATASAPARGTASVTEGADTASGASVGLIRAQTAVTEDPDTATGTGTILNRAQSSMTEGADTVIAQIGSNNRYATATITEGDDTTQSAGQVLNRASASLVEMADTASGMGGIVAMLTGAVTEGADTSTGAGRIFVSAMAALVEDGDMASSTVRPVVSGMAAMVEDADTSTGTGVVVPISPAARTVMIAEIAPRVVVLTR